MKPEINFRRVYDDFDIPVTDEDCGLFCARAHPQHKPFCCDIQQAVPAAYHEEWAYLAQHTDLWRPWQENQYPTTSPQLTDLIADTPESMCLIACRGHEQCQRKFRALSCRQFPFFPYLTEDYRFVGLAYEWHFEASCWVISHLHAVTTQYRQAFVHTFDRLFDLWPQEMDSYAALSAQMREEFFARRRRIPILHRNGKTYLLSPRSERLSLVNITDLPAFGPYRQD